MSPRQCPAASRFAGGRRDAIYRRLLKVCQERGCSPDDARDVVQEAHLRLFEYQRSAALKDPGSILRRIVVNISINRYHSGRAVPFATQGIDRLDRYGVLVHPGASPERTLAAEQELDAIVCLLSALSARTCQIFIAQRVGYSYEEVALAFAVKPRTVEKHVALAISKLSGEW